MAQKVVQKLKLHHHTIFTKFCAVVPCTAVLVLHQRCTNTMVQTAVEVSSTVQVIGRRKNRAKKKIPEFSSERVEKSRYRLIFALVRWIE